MTKVRCLLTFGAGLEAKRVTDEREPRRRRPEPGDGPPLRPRPYQSTQSQSGQPDPASTQGWRPADAEGTGAWTPNWDDDDTGPRHQRPAPSRPDPEATRYVPRPPLPGAREPELLTHREPLSTLDHDADTDELDTAMDNRRDPVALADRRRKWRRVRRIGYAVLGALILLPALAFAIGYLFIEVPSFAAIVNSQQQPTTVYYSDGSTELARFTPAAGNRINVSYNDIPEHVRNAVLSAEDRSFYSNPGFSITGIARAAWKQLTGGEGGGSTVTQQYVKVATQQDDFTLTRKFKEVVIASKLSKDQPKEQILENYLNIIYFGRQAYGIQAASKAYFNKDVKDLTVSEGALLAGMIQAPSRTDPVKNQARAQARWTFVLDGMVSEGWLSAEERAIQQFPKVIEVEEANAGSVTDHRRHIQNKIEEELAAQGIDRATLDRFGGKIVSTIDKDGQQKAVDAINKVLEGKPQNLHASLAAIDPKTGAVRAYFGGNDGTGYDLAGGTAWQPGSAFKPFVMLAALERDIGLDAVYPGKGPLNIGGTTVDNSESADYPPLPLKKAMTFSVNTAFIKLTDDVGPQRVADAAHQAGIPKTVDDRVTLVDPRTGDPPGLSIGLGAYEVRTLDMATAYATFAAEGTKRDAYFVQEYVGADGESRYKHVDRPVAAFDSGNGERNTQLACNVTESLTDVAAYSKFPLAGGRASAAKTGTAQRNKTGENANTWTVGYTPTVSAAVWVGDPAQTALKLGNRNVFGATVAGPIWKAFMDAYLSGAPKDPFPRCRPIGKAVVDTPNNPAAGGGVNSREPSATTEPPPTTTEAPTTTTTRSLPTFSRPSRPTRPTTSTTETTLTTNCGGPDEPACPPEPTSSPSG